MRDWQGMQLGGVEGVIMLDLFVGMKWFYSHMHSDEDTFSLK